MEKEKKISLNTNLILMYFSVFLFKVILWKSVSPEMNILKIKNW
jgi:hypothetical protein